MKRIIDFSKIGIPILLLVLTLGSCNTSRHPSTFIDPMIGTDGPGHTYPGPSLPFGMIQPGPDTRLSSWEGCSGYHYSDHFIYGFSHTHLSGTGALDYGDILLSPMVGKPLINPGSPENPQSGYGSTFSHRKETVSAGYYKVILDKNKIQCELTTSLRSALHRYRFKGKKDAHILIDLNHRDKVLISSMMANSSTEVVGLRRSQSWANDQYVYYCIQFSRPFKDFHLFLDEQEVPGSESNGGDVKGYFSFPIGSKKELLVKVGISAVSIDGARRNLETEIPNWDFGEVKQKAIEEWDKILSKIQINDDDAKKKRIFYTSMYHLYLNPNTYMDVDGMYRGRDLLIHQDNSFTNYSVFSLWDTFRAAHPFYTLMEPNRTKDFIETFLRQYEQGGMLPVWELSANETGTMIGYHSVSVITDAYIKGIRDFDLDQAFLAMKHSANQDHLGLNHYKELGYIPASEEGASVSKTLEYAYDDWCIAQMAHALGKDSDYHYFIQRAQNYKNVFDPESGFMRAKMGAEWFSPFDPKEVNYNYTEANAWQYSFFVPQDITGLINLMGGREAFTSQLDGLFNQSTDFSGTQQADITGMIGQYAQGNEPSHHILYLYDYVGQGWKTQEKVSEVMKNLYTDQADGLCGNEDCGQMSAWYLFSALGFYPVTPGTTEYAIGTPLFKEAVLNLPNGKTFRIKAPKVSDINIYVQSIRLNDQPYTKSFIDHSTLLNGGIMEFIMGPDPDPQWGSGAHNEPKTEISDHLIHPVPFIVSGDRTFSDQTSVELGSIDTTSSIYYEVANIRSLKMVSSRLYTKPIKLTNSRKIWFYSESDTTKSPTFVGDFTKLNPYIRVTQISAYAPQYSGGGDQSLIDGLRGARNYQTGSWQGFEGVDLNAEIDLGGLRTIGTLTLSCLQDQQLWIFAPKWVEYFISRDGKEWELAGKVDNDLDPKSDGTFIKKFPLKLWKTIRYVKIRAKNIGVCPDWHVGAGGKAWIFADELIIE